MTDPTTDRSELEDVIVAYVKKHGGAKLRGKYFDITKDEGRREYAEWLANEIMALNEYIEESLNG